MSETKPSLRAGLSRRTFLTTTAASTVVTACAPRARHTSSLIAPKAGGVLLFQGDSITDGDRDRDNKASSAMRASNEMHALGLAYPLLIAGALLGTSQGASWRIYNRGVGGNQVSGLQSRWAEDTLALRPDVLSILIGVNDYWMSRGSGYTSAVITNYETQYEALLVETRRALPAIRLVILEPFVLQYGRFVDASWFPEFDKLRAAAARVAQRAGATFVPLQEAFNARAAVTRPEDWLWDGIHPTLAGHALIADCWRAAMGV